CNVSPPRRGCGTLARMQDRSLASIASLAVALAAVAFAAPAAAQQPSTTAPTPPEATPAPAPAAPTPARKDPEGRSGISPYMEQVLKGQASFVARDIPGAIAAFQEAIKQDPARMLGFYRL